MNLKMTHVDAWTAEIDDKPGALARTLRAVADYGADLDYVVARRQPEKPGKGILYVAPLVGKDQLDNAGMVGLRRATEMPMLRIEGHNEPGLGSKLMKAIADAGVSMAGVSATVLGHKFVCYAGFDSVEDRQKAETALEAMHTPRPWAFWHHEEQHEPVAAGSK